MGIKYKAGVCGEKTFFDYLVASVWLVIFHQFIASCFPIADKFITVPFKCDNIDADVFSERNV